MEPHRRLLTRDSFPTLKFIKPDGSAIDFNSQRNTASILATRALIRTIDGDFAGARAYHERALAIREKALGPDHPDMAYSLNNLGYLLHAQGDFAGARAHFERGLAIREKALGPDHPNTATSLNNLGALLRKQGDLRERG